jgi:hypothetical protein
MKRRQKPPFLIVLMGASELARTRKTLRNNAPGGSASANPLDEFFLVARKGPFC